jgi:hypothetical protein
VVPGATVGGCQCCPGAKRTVLTDADHTGVGQGHEDPENFIWGQTAVHSEQASDITSYVGSSKRGSRHISGTLAGKDGKYGITYDTDEMSFKLSKIFAHQARRYRQDHRSWNLSI